MPIPARRGATDSIVNAFAQGQADILVGTQMVAKGLDIKRNFGGVISADLTLNLPDLAMESAPSSFWSKCQAHWTR